jgi:phosphoribosylformylglycinamidine (FGAM) synthase-like enzyme
MKPQKSTEIKNELNQTTKRLSELNEMKKGITDNHQNLHEGFVSGKTSLDNLQAEQSKLTTLDSSIAALEAKQDELHTAFQKASLSESRQTAIEQMKKLAGESEVAFNSYLALRAEIETVFAEAAQKLVDKISAWRKKQFQFGAIARASGLTESEIKAVPNNEKATAVTFSVPELEYGYAVSAAESILNSKLIKAIQAKEQSEFNERRFKRMDELPKQRMSETENVLEYSQNA